MRQFMQTHRSLEYAQVDFILRSIYFYFGYCFVLVFAHFQHNHKDTHPQMLDDDKER